MVDNRILAKIAQQYGSKLLGGAVGKVLPVATVKSKKSLTGKLVGAVLLRIASTSVPGAIIVAGGIFAKHLHARKKARKAANAGDTTKAGDRPA